MNGQHSDLTPRQRQIMVLAAEGLSNKQIARQFNLTEGTVKIHLHKIYQRLGISNRTSLAAFVHKQLAAE